MRLILLFARPGDMCVDVGANKGTWTSAMRHRVGRQGLVIAVEPQQTLADYLRRGFARSPEVEVHQCALSDEEGSTDLTIPIEEGRPVRGHATLGDIRGDTLHEAVRVTRLDSVVGQRVPALIKIDVEGHERSVIAGATELMARCRPALVVEMTDYAKASDTDKCFRTLVDDYGYSAAYLADDALRELRDWPPEMDLGTPNVVFAQSLPVTLR